MTAIPHPADRAWLSIAETAELLGEGQRVVRVAIARGQLSGVRFGRYIRVPTAALRQLLEIDTPRAEAVLRADRESA